MLLNLAATFKNGDIVDFYVSHVINVPLLCEENERTTSVHESDEGDNSEEDEDFIVENVSESSSDSEDDLGDIRLEEDEIYDEVCSDNDAEERSMRDEARHFKSNLERRRTVEFVDDVIYPYSIVWKTYCLSDSHA